MLPAVAAGTDSDTAVTHHHVRRLTPSKLDNVSVCGTYRRPLRGRRKGRGNATVIADDEFAVLVEVVRQLGDTEGQETKLAVVSVGDRDIRLGSPYRLHQTCALDARCVVAKCCRRCCLNDSHAHTGFFPVL